MNKYKIGDLLYRFNNDKEIEQFTLRSIIYEPILSEVLYDGKLESEISNNNNKLIYKEIKRLKEMLK